jgi:PAS domain S-box-containing protein
MTNKKGFLRKKYMDQVMYRSVFEHSHAALFITDFEGRILECNDAAAEMFGYTTENLKNMKTGSLVDAEASGLKEKLERRKKEGNIKGELIGIRKNGKKFSCEFSSSAFTDSQGKRLNSVMMLDFTDRKLAEERLKGVSNNVPGVVFRYILHSDKTDELQFVSDGAIRMWGFTAEEVMRDNRLIWDRVHKDDAERVFNSTVESAEKFTQWSAEWRYHHPDGTLRWYRGIGNPVWHDGGSVAWDSINLDITEEVKAKQRLAENKKQLTTTFEALKDAIFSLSVSENEKYHFISVNNQFLVNTGLGKEEVIGAVLEDVVPEESIDFVKAKYREAIGKSKNLRWEETVNLKTGNKSCIVSVTPLFDDRGNCYRLIGSVSDITERKAAEEALRKIMNQSLDVICTIDEEGRFVKVSEAAESVFGYPPEELIGKPFEELVYEKDWEKTEEAARQVMDGVELTNFENRYVRKNGSVVSVVWSVRWDEEDRLMYCVAKDATERKRAEQAVEQERQRYENLFMNLPVYVSVLSGKEHRYEMMNPRFLRLIGRDKQNIIGKTVKEVLPELEGQQVIELLDMAFEAGEVVEAREIPVRFERNGSENPETVYLNFTFIPDKNSEGEVKGLYTFGVNLTEEVEARRLVEESNERYEYVTQATSDAIWDFEFKSGKLIWGKGFETLFGYKRNENHQNFNDWHENLHPEDRERIETNIRKLIEEGGTRWQDEYRFRKANGEYAYVLDQAVIIRNKSGEAERIIGAMQDITRQKEEEQHLKMLESVITNTTDAVVITKGKPIEETGRSEVIYVNDAFTKMTGYKAEEVIGKKPRILKGANSDKEVLVSLRNALKKGKACEVETISFKKGGEEFWVNFSISPVAGEKGEITHWIALQKDVTERKNREIQRELQADISSIFNEPLSLGTALELALEKIATFGDFMIAEIWLIEDHAEGLHLGACLEGTEEQKAFYEKSNKINFFEYGDGLPGKTYRKGEMLFWRNLDKRKTFLRRETSVATGLKTAYGIPLVDHEQVVGVLVLGFSEDLKKEHYYTPILRDLGSLLGREIQRKKIETELTRIFSAVPDMICVADYDGYFKKVNPAMSQILEYSEEELLTNPIDYFIHPDDQDATREGIKKLARGEEKTYYENRYITKSGKVIWLAWSTKNIPEEEVIYGVAKDITQQHELEELLEQASRLARIGSWELNYKENGEMMYWSEMTRDILEADENLKACLTGFTEFYDSESKTVFKSALEKAETTGEPFDNELLIVTEKGNERWVRCIGQTEFANGKCVRLFGSFQDIDQRKKAEIAFIKASEERERILESISDAFFAVNADWNLTFLNREAENLLRNKSEDLVGKNIWEVFNPAVDIKLYNIFHEVMETRESRSFESYYPPIETWFEISVYSSEKGISVYFKNIDERKKAQAEIIEKTLQLDAIALFNGTIIQEDNWLKALEKCLKVFCDVVDADRIYYFENSYENPEEPTTTIRVEWVREEVDAQFHNPIHEKLPLSELGDFADVLLKKKAYNRKITDIADQQFREFLQSQDIKSLLALPVCPNNKFRGFIGFDDCTKERVWREEEVSFLNTIAINLSSAIENEDAEQALKQAFEEKKTILESIGDGFFTVDKKWEVTYWNNQAERLLETPREKIIGKYLWEVFSNALETESYQQYHRVLREQKPVTFEEYYEPVNRWFEVSAYPSKNGLSVFFKDVTQRKKAEERLQELNRSLENKAKELARSNAELEQFAFVASHDLQEPLRMITSFLAQLERKYGDLLDEKGKKYIHYATDGARRMRQIILDLLEFSRVGRIDVEKEDVDLEDILEDVVLLYKKQIEDKKAVVVWGEMPVIYGRRELLQQLFRNLLSNALKYHEKGGHPEVLVSFTETETHWGFSVKDNGIGISNEYKEKIFNIFQRLHNKDEYSGTGVGLAICKKIVEMHNGEIWMESEEGKGSTFYFTVAKTETE